MLSSHPRAQEGLFGFKPFPELWVGRLAMLGFAAGVGDEMVTGVPTLRQLGLITPNPDLFLTLSLVIGGVTLFATGAPARNAFCAPVTPPQAARCTACRAAT